MDIETRPSCNLIYDRYIEQSIELPIAIAVDVLISITLLEHVQNNENSIRSMFDALNRGGSMHHYIPSKWHPYAVVLRIVGPVWQKLLIHHLRPASSEITGYPAFFHHCTPHAMEVLLTRQGFTNINVFPFYRAGDYFAFFLPAYLIVAMFENLCSVLNWRFFASGFVISAEKPSDS